MTITVTREVTDMTINVTRSGNSVVLQPIISRNVTDSDIDGGTP